MIINPAPANHERYLGFIYFPNTLPNNTAMAEAVTRAAAEARKTINFEFSLSVANKSVAN